MKIEEPASHHFIVLCLRYPEFSFNIPALRKYRRERDNNPHATGTIGFHQRLLDSREQGLDEEEARIVYEALQQRTSLPIWGRDIVTKGQPILSETNDGRFTCGNCIKRFDSMEGLQLHYDAKHKAQMAA